MRCSKKAQSGWGAFYEPQQSTVSQSIHVGIGSSTRPAIVNNTACSMIYKSLRGFSLVELLVVMMILGLLAGIVGPRVIKYVGDSKSKTARIQIEDLSASLDLFLLDNGRYPTTEEGLTALVSAVQSAGNWGGPYLKKTVLPGDPWGNQYNYRSPGEHGAYDLYSLGADNALGGEGESKDINSWE